MKDVLSKRAPEGMCSTRELILAAKIANVEVPPEVVANTHYAACKDNIGAPTRIHWKPFMNHELQPPPLRGPGGFGELPPLRKNSRRPSADDAPAAAPASAPMVEQPTMPRASSKETAYWFGLLVSKMKDRFTEVRRAFRLLDEDCNGFLSADEFKKILVMFNMQSMPDPVFNRIIQLIDKNGNDVITFAEFAELTNKPSVLEELKAQVD
jgi:hypothetical protein